MSTCHCTYVAVGYTTETLTLSWLDKPVDIDPDVQLPDFTLEDLVLIDCTQNYTIGRLIVPTGTILLK
jgi:hypothetical protein